MSSARIYELLAFHPLPTLPLLFCFRRTLNRGGRSVGRQHDAVTALMSHAAWTTYSLVRWSDSAVCGCHWRVLPTVVTTDDQIGEQMVRAIFCRFMNDRRTCSG